jgi:putative cardiolipin synthase
VKRARALVNALLVVTPALLAGCATSALEVPHARPVERALSPQPDVALGRWVAEHVQPGRDGLSGAYPVATGQEALALRLAMIHRAERSLDLQYYIWRPDASGRLLLDALAQAACRGVRVRLLLDDWGTRPPDAELARLQALPHFHVRLFNPLPVRVWRGLGMLLQPDLGHRRMHNKLVLADGHVALVGGRNVGDEYFDRLADLAFSDLDMLVAGAVTPALADSFDAYWNSPHAVALRADDTVSPAANCAVLRTAPEQGHLPARLRRVPVQSLADPPDKIDLAPGTHPHSIGARLSEALGGVAHDLVLISPYFVPGEEGVAQIQALTAAGVRVRIVTNSLAATDVPIVHAGYARYREALLASGAELYETRADSPRRRVAQSVGGSSRVSLHAKAMIVDGRRLYVGSMNLDPRSLHINTENGVLLDDPGLAGRLVQDLERAQADRLYRLSLTDGQLSWHAADGRIAATSEPDVSWWQRLKLRLLSLFAVERLL